MSQKLVRKAAIIMVLFTVLMLCVPASYATVKIDKDKSFDDLFYVYGGKKCRATCVIDEITMPYYEAVIEVEDPAELSARISEQKKLAKTWLTKHTKKKHTYKITFKQYRHKKWRSVPKYTIKKSYKRKFRISATKKSDTKAVVYGTISYTGKDEKYFKTKKFKKGVRYVEKSPQNEPFYFSKNGKFHWQPSGDDNE